METTCYYCNNIGDIQNWLNHHWSLNCKKKCLRKKDVLFLLRAYKLIQVSLIISKQSHFYELADTGQIFQRTIFRSPIRVKEYWRYSGATAQPFKPTNVQVTQEPAFGQAFPSFVILQHQYLYNESTQKLIWWKYISFSGIRFGFAVIPIYVGLNCHGTAASFFRI